MTEAEIIAGIEQKQKETHRLLAQLKTWALLKARGIDPESVELLGWERPKRETGREEWQGTWLYNCGQPRWLNCARLKDGSVVKFDPVPNTFADSEKRM